MDSIATIFQDMASKLAKKILTHHFLPISPGTQNQFNPVGLIQQCKMYLVPPEF